MAISYDDFVKTTARSVRGVMVGLVLLGGLISLTGCPSKDEPKKKETPKVETPAPKVEPPKVEAKISVDEKPFVIPAFNENGPEAKVTLPYSAQGGAVPTSCEVSALSKVTESSPCACVGGTCSVGIQPEPRLSGDGSFSFRFSGQNGVTSNLGKASVKILEVTLSIDSGDKQTGPVGKALLKPIIVSVKNSNGVPIPGVKIFWNVKKWEKRFALLPDWTEAQIGKVSSCTEKTDDQGFAQCIWTLGERLPVQLSPAVDVSAFYEGDYKKTSFSVAAVPGSAVWLSYWNQDYTPPKNSVHAYLGPTTPAWVDNPDKRETAGLALGRLIGKPGEKKPLLTVFVQDQYGNATTINGNVSLTLAFGSTKPGGAVLSGTNPVRMKNENIATNWTQGVAEFQDISLNKAGKYTLTVTASDTNLKARQGKFDFGPGSEFTVDPGAAAKLVFTTQPVGGSAANPLLPTQPVVAVQDSFGNTVTSSTAKIDLAITIPEPLKGVLTGTSGLNADAIKGVATFSGLSISNLTTAPYILTLTASSAVTPTLTPAISDSITVAP